MLASFFAFLEALSPWWWVAFGIGLGAAEMLSMSFFLIGPGLAAIVMGVVLTVFSGMPGTVRLALYAALSVALTLAFMGLRGRLRAGPESPALNDRTTRMIGRRGTVVTFDNGEGTVSIDGVHWRARCDPRTLGMTAGAAVRVDAADGSTLVVSRDAVG